MKTLALAIMGAMLLGGCTVVTLHTNLPFFYDYSFEVINASDYELEATANGKPLTFHFKNGEKSERMKSGQSGAIYFQNFSGYTAEMTVSLKGWYAHGELAGAATRKIYIAGTYKQADSWIVNNETFTDRYNSNGW